MRYFLITIKRLSGLHKEIVYTGEDGIEVVKRYLINRNETIKSAFNLERFRNSISDSGRVKIRELTKEELVLELI